MKLIKCHIQNFGKLSGVDYTFSEGLNTILWNNGEGKTTLAVFIKAMLFDLVYTRKNELSENERQKYTPWQGGSYGGWLEIEANGKHYKIDRMYTQQAKKSSKMVVTDLDTMKTVDLNGEEPGFLFLGLHEDSFENSLYFSQRALCGHKDGNSDLNNRLISMQEANSVADLDTYDGAIRAVNKAATTVNSQLKAIEERDVALHRIITDACDADKLLEESRQDEERLEVAIQEMLRQNEQDKKDVELLRVASIANEKERRLHTIVDEENELNQVAVLLQGKSVDDPLFDDLFVSIDTYISEFKAFQLNKPTEKDQQEQARLMDHFDGRVFDAEELNRMASECLDAEVQLRQVKSAFDQLKEQMTDEQKEVHVDSQTIAKLSTISDQLNASDFERMRIRQSTEDAQQLASYRAQYGSSQKIKEDYHHFVSLLNQQDEADFQKAFNETMKKKKKGSLLGVCASLGLMIMGLILTIFVHLACLAVVGCGLIGTAVFGFGWSQCRIQKVEANEDFLHEMQSICKNYGFTEPNMAKVGVLFEQVVQAFADLEADEDHWNKELVKFNEALNARLEAASSMVGIQFASAQDLNDYVNSLKKREEQQQKHNQDYAELFDQVKSLNEKQQVHIAHFDKYVRSFGYELSGDSVDHLEKRMILDFDAFNKAKDTQARRAKEKEKLQLMETELREKAAPWLDDSSTLESQLGNIKLTLPEVRSKYRNLLQSIKQNKEALDALCKENQEALSAYAQQKERIQSFDYDSLQETVRQRENTIDQLKRNLFEVQRTIRDLSEKADRLPDYAEEREALMNEKREFTERERRIKKVAEYLTTAKDTMSSRYLTPMRKYFSYYLELLGKDSLFVEHPDANVNTDLDVHMTASGQALKEDALSAGQKDLLAICRHLALTDAIYEDSDEKPILVLDDPFVNLDDHVLQKALLLIRDVSKRYQMIYMTCHSSRQ